MNLDWLLYQLDVKNAFLHSDLEEEVFIQQLPRYVAEGESDKVCLLKKPIYGLKQSPQAWFNKFSNLLTQFGFSRTVSDYSICEVLKSSLCMRMAISGSDVAGISETERWLQS